jgi:hypothetical protein
MAPALAPPDAAAALAPAPPGAPTLAPDDDDGEGEPSLEHPPLEHPPTAAAASTSQRAASGEHGELDFE